MKTWMTLSAVLAACTFAVPAMAQRGGEGVDARQDRQQLRIERGYRSGELTRQEVRRLDRGQDRIDRMQDRARADGRVTRGERERIHREVARQDRHIWRERHDGQRWRAERGYRDHGHYVHRGHDDERRYGDSGYRDRRHVHAPVVRKVYVDPRPRISLVLNLP
jgi:hypothetical protein